jgi:pyruvate/2-oxoglutarate dehydrogenase complex dihydrolipoamide dehydrogenase (E3) component
MSVEYDLVIIGGGSAGLVVASAAAQLKAKVALVERDRLGGDCLWYGCVPSKSLIHAAKAVYRVKQAQQFGVDAHINHIDVSKAFRHVQQVIQNIEPHDSPERFRGLGVEVIFGEGQFLDGRRFQVSDRVLTARNFVISTGSRPAKPDIPGLSAAGYLTNEQVFNLTEVPPSLAIIGGGPVGCELGQALHRLGAQVTIITRADRLLPKEEPEAAAIIHQQFKDEGIEILTRTNPQQVTLVNGEKHIDCRDRQITVAEILLAAGRQPNIDSLNLNVAGVEYTNKGIKVNHKLQTTNPHIYACGDVIGGYQFTHVAGYEASVVIKNALFFPTTKANYRVIPCATFTDPEVARVGLTESEAKQKYGADVYILNQEYAGVDRAQAEAATTGFAKIIVRGNGEILGAHLVGESAGELIHEMVFAMSQNLKVSALSSTIHIYPTLSEIGSKAALQLTKQKYAQNRRLQTILTNFFNFRRRYF